MINLLLAIHNHQPVGNFEHVFEKAFKECYFPVLSILAEFPKVKISIHHSGPLLDWAKEHEPDYLPMLVRLIKSGQIEVLGGGYYEPILAVIPPEDAKGQLKMMKDFWESEAGFKPRGIWLTERIWEPSLTSLLSQNDIEYTILDDEHFRAAGITDEFILNYYLTERHGKTVAVFASDQTLRYKIPFKPPEDVITHLKYLANKFPDSAVTYGDDGEKFGLWPGTHEWVIKNGWLKNFFKLLSENSDTIKTLTFSEYISTHKPSGTVYLPTCSYHEMGEWAMPIAAIKRMDEVKRSLESNGKWEEAKPFVRGGYWDNFLTKYPETNYMHKRMLYVSGRISDLKFQISDQRSPDLKVGVSSALQSATQALYRAQCNCAYWHGLFGGLYLNYLRNAVFKNLLEAENILDSAESQISNLKSLQVDIDCDHHDEIVLSNKHLIAVVKPNKGGSLIELSYRDKYLNLLDVLARREEAYHKKSVEAPKPAEVKDPAGIPSIHDINKAVPNAEDLIYDERERYSFFDKNISFEIISAKDGTCKLRGENKDLIIQKEFCLSAEAGFNVKYQISWKAPLTTPTEFTTDINLTLLAGHDSSRHYLFPTDEKCQMDTVRSLSDISEFSLVDEYFKFQLKLRTSRKMNFSCYPINTVSQSESGFDLLYQGSCIIWSALVPKNTRDFEFEIKLNFTAG